jgi:hypothetical protein
MIKGIMIEDGNDIPIGIVTAVTLYAMYMYILDKMMQIYKVYIQTYRVDNWIMFIIYFVPLVILYIEIPILLRKFNNQKYIE